MVRPIVTGKKNPGLFKKKNMITLKHIAYGKTIVFSKCVPHRIVGRFQEKLHLFDE